MWRELDLWGAGRQAMPVSAGCGGARRQSWLSACGRSTCPMPTSPRGGERAQGQGVRLAARAADDRPLPLGVRRPPAAADWRRCRRGRAAAGSRRGSRSRTSSGCSPPRARSGCPSCTSPACRTRSRAVEGWAGSGRKGRGRAGYMGSGSASGRGEVRHHPGAPAHRGRGVPPQGGSERLLGGLPSRGHLTALGVDTLIVAGESTSGCVRGPPWSTAARTATGW